MTNSFRVSGFYTFNADILKPTLSGMMLNRKSPIQIKSNQRRFTHCKIYWRPLRVSF
jgi:hypothetical protein